MAQRNRSSSHQTREGASHRDRNRQASHIADNCTSLLGLPPAAPSSTSGSTTLASGDKGASSRTNSPEINAYIEACIEQRKRQLVDKLMATVVKRLDQTLGPIEAACDASEDDESGRSKSSGGSQKPSSGDQGRQAAGKKRQLGRRGREDSPDNNGGSGSGQDRTSKRNKKDSDDHRKKFACPFAKRYPEKYKNRRTCCGPGWSDVRRLK